MKKVLIGLAVALAAVFTAKADYIYAMIQEAYYWDWDGINKDVNFDYVTVKGNGDIDYLYFYTADSSAPLSQRYASDSVHTTYSDGAYGSDPEGFFVGYDGKGSYTSFLFELWTQTGEYAQLLGQREVSLAALQAAGAVTAGTSDSGATAYRISEVVPEPTGGLLMLLGMAMVALKRRRSC